jgi:hypothetical protein
MHIFLKLLEAHRITMLVDVHMMSGSGSNPQFNQDTLPPAFEKGAICYRHVQTPDGLRRRTLNSPNAIGPNVFLTAVAAR